MAIPELEMRRVEAVLATFCDRVPPHARSQLWYVWKVRGNALTLAECRPHFLDKSRTTENPFARLVFDPASHTWSLRWCDRNGRFHAYEGFQGVRRFEDLLAEVDRDPTGIFFG